MRVKSAPCNVNKSLIPLSGLGAGPTPNPAFFMSSCKCVKKVQRSIISNRQEAAICNNNVIINNNQAALKQNISKRLYELMDRVLYWSFIKGKTLFNISLCCASRRNSSRVGVDYQFLRQTSSSNPIEQRPS